MSFECCSENLNVLWADLIVEELVRLGVTQFYISPGSRNSPIITAISRHTQVRAQLIYDERSAAFLALGYAKSQGVPAVLVCTSGSALFHYYPAVLEASQEAIPLLVLSADRPPELHDCGANQSIKQRDAFGAFTRWHLALPCPDLAVAPEYLLKSIDQACFYARGYNPGPVQINLPFREPLSPELQAIPETYLNSVLSWQATDKPHTQASETFTTVSASSKQTLINSIENEQNGLLLVGRLNRLEDQEAVFRLARHLHWPVIADALSGLSLTSDLEVLLKHQDLLLGHQGYCRALNPQTILHVGQGFVSGPVLKHISSLKPDLFVSITSQIQREDPYSQSDLHFQGQISHMCHELMQQTSPQAGTRWSHRLYQASEQAVAVLKQSDHVYSNISVVREALRSLPNDGLVFTGNSLSVRLLDTYAETFPVQPKLFANRGLSGIDGNLSTALGIAQAEHKPILVCLGDLTLLHDLNALGVAAQMNTPFVILLLNNQGGGIFHHLPIAQHDEIFEPWFGTPHQLSFQGAAEMFSLPYQQIEQLPALKASLEKAFQHPGASLIEVQTDRQEDYQAHNQLKQKVSDVLDVLFSGDP